MSDGYFQRNEAFDVVMVKKGASALTAKPDEFKRISVMAPEPSLVGDDADVVAAAKEGWTQVEVVSTGRPSDYETMSRHRAQDAE